MKKTNRAEEGIEQISKSTKRVRSATNALSICAALIALFAVAATVSGLCNNKTVMYAVIGVMAAAIVICTVSLSGAVRKLIKNEERSRDAIRQRIRGLAAGDAEAAYEDAYDYEPVDGQTCEALKAALEELNTQKTRGDSLGAQLSGTSDDRDEYQFRMLGAQMVPGMIERAILKIGRVAEQRKINDIAAFSRNLCDLMNSSLSASKKPTSLASELGLIRTYLDLDDAITGRRTEYRMSVMCSIVGYKLVPHLILPVVENLLEHSERSKTSQYELAIEINSDPENVTVNIRDNGRGIDVDTMERIERCLESNTIDTDDDPLSLPSINRRIVLCYGENYGLQVSSSKMGTNVKITLPPKPDPFYEEK